MKIAIVGSGSVGAAIGYTIVCQGVASVVLMTDHVPKKADGEAMDLQHCASFVPPVDILSGDLSMVRSMDAVIITAGVKRRPGELRTDLIRRNIDIFKSFSFDLAESNPDAIFIIVSNPVDLLTHYFIQNSGLPARQIIGSGTLLDTSRLRHLLSEYLSVDPRNVHAHVIGEHGEGSVPLWSQARVGTMPIEDFAQQVGLHFGPKEQEEVFQQMLKAGQDVIERKGATFFGIAQTVVRILNAIARDETSILTISTDPRGFEGISDISLSVPAIISRGGVKRIIRPLLSQEESARFTSAANSLKLLASENGI